MTKNEGAGKPDGSDDILHRRCRGCGETAVRLLLFAAMKDAGARGRNPLECSDGKEHDFND